MIMTRINLLVTNEILTKLCVCIQERGRKFIKLLFINYLHTLCEDTINVVVLIFRFNQVMYILRNQHIIVSSPLVFNILVNFYFL